MKTRRLLAFLAQILDSYVLRAKYESSLNKHHSYILVKGQDSIFDLQTSPSALIMVKEHPFSATLEFLSLIL